MTRREPGGHRCIAKRYLHAVRGDDVAFRRHRFVPVGIFRDRIPIGSTHNDSNTVPCLQHLGAPDVIPMSVRDEDILDVLWIEAKLLHPTDDQFLGVVRINRIDENDPFSRRQSPGGVKLTANKIEIVKDLGGLSVPGITRRRASGIRDVRWQVVAQVFAPALRQKTRANQGAEELEAGRRLGRL